MITQRKIMTLMGLLLAAIVIAWSSGSLFAADKISDQPTLTNTGKTAPVLKPKEDPAPTTPQRPILTKSGKKAALMKAAEAILQPPVTMLAPISPTDETKVPHYFGPFPNWANSPFTLPDVAVAIVGDGTGATATATVGTIAGTSGIVTGITLTSPGSGYSAAATSVVITGGGTGATADVVINPAGVVTSVTVGASGAGYTEPVVDFTGGGATTQATAIVYGGVDAVNIANAGAGYTNPTVDFDMPDGPDGVKATAHAEWDPVTGVITAVIVDQPGSGYSFAPNVIIRDGTLYDPIIGGTGAAATATLAVQTVALQTFGTGYTAAPTVTISDTVPGTGAGATATAFTDAGAITAINLTAGGSGYITAGGMKKFQDGLPQLCDPSVAGQCAAVINNLGQYIPLAVPDTTTFSAANGFTPEADYYVIGVVQTRMQMSSSLPKGTLVRAYVQLQTPANAAWSKSISLVNELVDGTSAPALMPNGSQAIAVDNPQWLGPVIAAQKDRPVRIVFYNLLPTGADGDLFLPTDSTLMGSGLGPIAMAEPVDSGTVMDEVRNPLCTEYPKAAECFKDNRATLHLHGGITPWISDGTPHQWITPANETTPWPEGVSVGNVPDMKTIAGVPDCSAENDGCQTFYYTNQQSARLMFYHDHAWGITRLNVYAGEAAGYLISDSTEQNLVATGVIPADQIPLVIQDRTFLPDPTQLAWQDPTWDMARWGDHGDFWYHHVYMPAQNPGDPSGMSAYGRWMYGPWFWPPATPLHPPIANPYYDPACNLDNPATWQYGTDPFCEPPMMPGTPNISAGMEQFNDTPIVNGTAYPTTTLEPKTYRLRILNAANDRFWNLQWYVADPTTGTDSEVALNPAELAAAQLDPVVFPTPDTSVSPPGPSWIQIGSEGGFLPAPVVVPNQPITWITDPTRFDVGNVDQHSLLLAPAERADVIVDFSQFAGKTLILYNDAPAAFPARVPSYDYYTGAPDLSPAGAPAILPGYGPNTRTVMQVKVAGTASPPFNLTKLQAAFRHKADASGVFESGQHPIIVGQAAYNSAYGTNFPASSYCNGGNTTTLCDGYARISDQGGTLFGFNTLKSPTTKLEIPLEPKALHDEMNSASFDEFGRMSANIGLELVPATPATQNMVLYPFVNPPTELIDTTNLPQGDINITPIGSADGTQIWKITHNGVDTHPIHFHLFDVQLLNRVAWDNIITPPDASELGWKDTVRISPLQDTIVALRPIVPTLPFELPNSIRPLNPMLPIGSMMGFNNMDANGNPTAPVVNNLVNFGWEYVWHCHILSHEEMDMMRPVAVGIPPKAPTGLITYYSKVSKTGTTYISSLRWMDNALTETQSLVQRKEGTGPWVTLATLVQPLDQPNSTGLRSYVDSTPFQQPCTYRVVAENTIGYGGEFMDLTARSYSNSSGAPTGVTTLVSVTPPATSGGPVTLTWSYTATDGNPLPNFYYIQRALDPSFSLAAGRVQFSVYNMTTYSDSTAQAGQTYYYRVFPHTVFGDGVYSNTMSVTTP